MAYNRFQNAARCPLWVISRHVRRNKSCPLCANSGRHSITSSARPTSVLGTLRPSALAVFRLM